MAVTNVFLEYAAKLNLKNTNDVNKIKDLILENIGTISKNALSERFIEEDRLNSVTPLSLDISTLRFIPKNSGLIYQLAPLSVSSIFGWERSDDAKHIQDFIDFLTSYAPELTRLKIEDKDFISYLHHKYEKLNLGLAYLSEFYNRSQRSDDHEKVVASQTALNRLKIYCALVSNTFPEYNSLKEGIKLLDLRRFSPLNRVMDVRQQVFAPSEIEKKLEGHELTFFASCIRMKDQKFQDFCTDFERVLRTQDANLIYGELLKHKRFSSMHLWLAKKVLAGKTLGFQADFDKYSEEEPVKLALKCVKEKIIALKSSKDSITEFIKLFKYLNDSTRLAYYKPFQHILNFVSRQFNTPEIHGYPGLPLWMIERADIEFFVVSVWKNSEDFFSIDMTTHEGRMVLLKSAEFLFGIKAINDVKLNAWSTFCAKELPYFPKILNCI